MKNSFVMRAMSINLKCLQIPRHVYSGHLRFLKYVSAITRWPLYRNFSEIFTGRKFRKFCAIWTILRKFVPSKIIAKFLIYKICEIPVRTVIVYRNTRLGNWKLLIIELIVNINLDYLKKTVHNLFTTNIQGGVL